MRRGARRVLLVAAAAVGMVAIGAVSIAVVARGDGAARTVAADASSPEARVSHERFAVLSRASSNRCGLQAEDLDTFAHDGRLQGACCKRMSFHRYVEQVSGLRRYADVSEVPSDPYDIAVSLAERLLSYQKSVELTTDQQATYDRAIALSDEGGPCCCRCWRWSAFEGQAKVLISRRRYSAEQIAEIWTLEDGCGGNAHVHRT